MNERQIFVASESPLKLAVVERSFREVFSSLKMNLGVEGVAAASEINAQPVGLPETLRGAKNRSRNAREVIGTRQFSHLVSIENGIYRVQKRWLDAAMIILESTEGVAVIVQSAGVEIPQDVVEETRKRGFENTTIGDVMHGWYGYQSDDPHKRLTNGLISRADLLHQGLITAIGQMSRRGLLR